MIAKKNPKSDLERYRSLFFLTAVALVLGLVLVVLEHKTAIFGPSPDDQKREEASVLTVKIPITVRDTPEKPKPKPKTKIDYTKKPEPEVDPDPKDLDLPKPKLNLGAAEAIDEGDPLEFFDVKTIDVFFVQRIARPKECENLNDQSEQLACLNAWIQKHLSKNLRYPEMARTFNAEEKIYVEFVVDEFGNVESAVAKRAQSEALAEEAERVVKNFPTLVPASQHNRPVKMRMVIPVNFKLR